MPQLAPDWSDKIDEESTPVDPLDANRSRNRITNLFAHARGIQVLSLYLVVQQVVSSSNFLTGLQNHPRFPEEDIERFVDFAVEGGDSIVDYGLVGNIQWTFTLKDAFDSVQGLQ